MLRIYIIAFTLFWTSIGSANTIDSLWGVWNDENQLDSNRYRAIQLIFIKQIRFVTADSSLKIVDLQLQLAEKSGNQKWIAKAFTNKGICFTQNNNYSEAIQFYEQSLSICKKLNSQKGMSENLYYLGHVYTDIGNYEKALEFYFDCLEIFKELGDSLNIANGFSMIGIVYKRKLKHEKALSYFNKSLKIFQNHNDIQGIKMVSNNKGAVYYNQKRYEEALEHFIFYLQNINDGDKTDSAMILMNLGNVYKELGQQNKAIEHYNKSLRVSRKIEHKEFILSIHLYLGEISHSKEEYDIALLHADSAHSIAKQIDLPNNISQSSYLLYRIYKSTGFPIKALEFHELHIQMSDTVKIIENEEAALKVEYHYKYETEKAINDAKNTAELEKQKLITYATAVGLLLVLGFAFLFFNRFRVAKKQKGVIQQKNKHITESINYAKRIQTASLTTKKYLDELFEHYFVLYQPRDIVSGDFYWTLKLDENRSLVAVCDCTGHGVPGGFMSMISISLINKIVIEKGITQVDQVLNELRSEIILALKQEEQNAEALDGIDMTILLIDKMKQCADFAGAGHTLYQARGKEIIEHKGDSFPVGYFFGREKPYTRKEIKLEKADVLYMTTDGFTEQFGGNESKLYGIKRFKNLILESSYLPMEEQKEKFSRSYNKWKGAQKQIDDVCVMGIRV